ncbi:hypothetical protein R3P38DRAFT_3339901 [Favolaschia claudopus]|uniref:Uncharacterized protein n=1 Tax=Favolaschia claudopus TaxID=2862362 RepID=A0AAW0EKL9_9AGAR
MAKRDIENRTAAEIHDTKTHLRSRQAALNFMKINEDPPIASLGTLATHLREHAARGLGKRQQAQKHKRAYIEAGFNSIAARELWWPSLARQLSNETGPQVFERSCVVVAGRQDEESLQKSQIPPATPMTRLSLVSKSPPVVVASVFQAPSSGSSGLNVSKQGARDLLPTFCFQTRGGAGVGCIVNGVQSNYLDESRAILHPELRRLCNCDLDAG